MTQSARGARHGRLRNLLRRAEDPRTGNAALHHFYDLLIIALCTVLASGENATDMAECAKAKEPFLRGFLGLSNGLPSHNTSSRLFRLLDPDKFGAAFQ